jgi:hypothetical protein
LLFNFIFLISSLFFSNPDTLYIEKSFGSFQSAASISTARDEFAFVSDTRANQVLKFNSRGEQTASVGGSGFGQNQLNKPMGVDASSGLEVFVCDNQNNRIQKYDFGLNYVSAFDFNTYNVTALNSEKIFYPYSLCFLSTSEIFVIADATVYKIVKMKSFDEVTLFFASGNLGVDKLYNPTKIVKGSNLDTYVLDKFSNDIINFDNYGTFVKKLQEGDTAKIVSMAYYNDKLYILKEKYLVSYDLKANKYLNLYFLEQADNQGYVDIAMLNKSTIMVLTQNKIFSYKIINN